MTQTASSSQVLELINNEKKEQPDYSKEDFETVLDVFRTLKKWKDEEKKDKEE